MYVVWQEFLHGENKIPHRMSNRLTLSLSWHRTNIIQYKVEVECVLLMCNWKLCKKVSHARRDDCIWQALLVWFYRSHIRISSADENGKRNTIPFFCFSGFLQFQHRRESFDSKGISSLFIIAFVPVLFYRLLFLWTMSTGVDTVMRILDSLLRNNDERPYTIRLPHGNCIFTTREPQPSSVGSFNAGGVIHL